MFKVMVLGIARDRGAFSMAFLLPPVIFIIFAAVFSGTSGDEMRLSLAIVDEVRSPASEKLVDAIRREPSLRVQSPDPAAETDLRTAVSLGAADVGLLIRHSLTDEAPPSPIIVITDAGRALTGPIVAGHVQRLIASELPGVTLRRIVPEIETLTGGLSEEQQARLAAGMDALDAADIDEEAQAQEAGAGLVEIDTLTGGVSGSSSVSYYAGAVAVMFLLLSAMQGAASLIEERTSGILDRVAVGPAGTDVIVASKFLFLTIQGICQVSLIFIVAWLAYGVDFLGRFGPWLATTALASAAAAGLALMIAAMFTTKQQATTVSSFLVLLASAIGGSMVPRFMMPPWLQEIGWLTPNAWAIEAYQGVLWRGQGLADLMPSFLPLAATALIGLIAALGLSRYRLRLG
jgi:ABC-2 type transport system permease protein